MDWAALLMSAYIAHFGLHVVMVAGAAGAAWRWMKRRRGYEMD